MMTEGNRPTSQPSTSRGFSNGTEEDYTPRKEGHIFMGVGLHHESGCWIQLLKPAAETSCWNQLLKPAAETSCWNQLLKPAAELLKPAAETS